MRRAYLFLTMGGQPVKLELQDELQLLRLLYDIGIDHSIGSADDEGLGIVVTKETNSTYVIDSFPEEDVILNLNNTATKLWNLLEDLQ